MAASIKLISPAGGSVTLSVPSTTDNLLYDIGNGVSATTMNVSNNLVVGGSANIAGNANIVGTLQVTGFSNLTTANIATANISGNLNFTGTGNRITGDFSNATLANRVALQTSTTNGASTLNIIPNGTSLTAGYNAFNAADPTNAGQLNAFVNGSEVSFRATIQGTGSYLPMTFYTNGSERMRISTAGGFSVGTATDPGAGYISDIIGNVRSVPQNAQTSSYILVASDNGKHISITTGGVTINSGIHSVGDTITIFNNSSSSQTITQGTSVTLRQSATTNTGNRTLAGYGICTILCVAANTFVITGSGIT